MPALVAILLLLFTPAVMLFIRTIRPNSRFLWWSALLGTLLAWVALFLARYDLPFEFNPQTWQPETFFPLSPALLVDRIAWILALALGTHALAIMLTGAARLGEWGTPSPTLRIAGENVLTTGDMPPATEPSGDPAALHIAWENKPVTPGELPKSPPVNWKAWAANLAFTSLGLVAVMAGNLLTLLLAWSALDLLELLTMLRQVNTGEQRAKVVRAYGARSAGTVVLLLAGMFIWAEGGVMQLHQVNASVNLLLFIAAGFRLGILPLQVPYFDELPLRIGLGTTLRLVPAAGSLILVVRTAEVGLPGTAGLALLGFIALAGLVSSAAWLRATTALSGRPYWLVACASLALAAGIQALPTASLAWSLALLLPGSLVFLSSLRSRSQLPVLVLGWLWLSALPFTPLWPGSHLFYPIPASAELVGQIIRVILTLILFITHALLLAGYLRHSLSGTAVESTSQPAMQRWVWLLYLPGLVVLPVIHFFLGWLLQPEIAQAPLVMWLEGASALGVAGAVWFSLSKGRLPRFRFLSGLHWLSSGQVTRSLFQPLVILFRLLAQVIRISSAVLEGEAGILWAFVLLVFGLLFLRQ